MEHFKISDLKYILNLHKGFRTTPLWLHKQAPVDFSPKLKSSLVLLAQIYANKYFNDKPTTIIGSNIPYYLPVEEAQMAELQISMKLGPLRSSAFIDEIILSFVYPTSTTQLCQLMGRALKWLDMEFYLQKITDVPGSFYLQSIFSHAFVEEKMQLEPKLELNTLQTILRAAAANGNLEQVQILWPKIKERLSEKCKITFPIQKTEQQHAYHLAEFTEMRLFSPLTTCIAGTANFEVFSYLVEEGYPFLLSEDEDLFKSIVDSGETKHLEYIFAKDPVEPYRLNFSPFEAAVVKADQKMIQCLCNLGFRLNRHHDASTPLFLSISRKLYPTTEVLLQNGASLGFAFKQGFGGGVLTPDFLAYTETPDLILFSHFLDEVTEQLLYQPTPEADTNTVDEGTQAISPLLQHYLEDKNLFTTALEDLLEEYSSLTYGEIECMLWVLASMDNLALLHPGVKVSHIQTGDIQPVESFLVDLNHFMLLLLQQVDHQDNLKNILLELGKRNDYCFIPWQKIIPMLLDFKEDSFDQILHATGFFFRFRDANISSAYLSKAEDPEVAFKLLEDFYHQSPALYLAYHKKYKLLGQLLKRQQDLPFWQSQFGDSLLSLALMQGDEKLILTLTHHGASLSLSLQIAIQEGNLFLCEYILFWVLRNMRFNHAIYYQALILQGLDIHSLILAAKSQGKRQIYCLFFDWLKLFPAHLQIFSAHAELLESEELSPKDIALRPTQLSKAIKGELLNPNHRLSTQDPLEESDYLSQEFRFSTLLQTHEINTANLFAELHPTQSSSLTTITNGEEESFIKELTRLHAQEKKAPENKDEYLPALCTSTPEALRVVVLYHNPATKNCKLILHDLHTEKAVPFEDKRSKILPQMTADTTQYFFLSKNEFLLLDLKGQLEIWSLKSLQPIQSQTLTEGPYQRAFLSQDQNKLFLQGEDFSLLWDIKANKQIHILTENNFLSHPLHFEDKLIGMDQGTWMNSSPGLFHHLYHWEFDTPTPRTETPCPLLKPITPVQFGKPICFEGENELMRPSLQFYRANSQTKVTFHFDSQPIKLLSQSKDGTFALVLEDHHAKILDLSGSSTSPGPSTSIVNLDFSWIESATFAAFNQFLILIFKEDQFRGFPPKFEIYNILERKVIFSQSLTSEVRPIDLQNEELTGYIDQEDKIQIFDLIHFHYLTAIQYLLYKNAEI